MASEEASERWKENKPTAAIALLRASERERERALELLRPGRQIRAYYAGKE
jgi:hypothetical protein